jgi:plasmid stability protein
MEPVMPTLTIKGLPDPLYRRLKKQAEAHRRSLNGEIIACLERAVGSAPIDPAKWLAEALAFRSRVEARPLTDRQLRAARRAGRA